MKLLMGDDNAWNPEKDEEEEEDTEVDEFQPGSPEYTILKFLETNKGKPFKASELSENLSISQLFVKRALKALERSEGVIRLGKGRGTVYGIDITSMKKPGKDWIQTPPRKKRKYTKQKKWKKRKKREPKALPKKREVKVYNESSHNLLFEIEWDKKTVHVVAKDKPKDAEIMEAGDTKEFKEE